MPTITIERVEHLSLQFPAPNSMGSAILRAVASNSADGQLEKDLDQALRERDTSRTATLVPPAQSEEWPGQGGYYICTMPAIQGAPAYHLVQAQAEAEDLEYGGRDHDTPGAASQRDGAANTAALLADSKPHPAAQWAAGMRAEGHADFYLPSRAELFLAWLCTPQLFKKSGYYWSSTQHSRHYACVQDFENGSSCWGDKYNEFRAVAVRRIPLL